ncbi:MAG: discoidin domain-containing protein, partial [bacterium]
DGVEVPMGAWPTDLINGERTVPPVSGHNPVKQVNEKTYYLPMETSETIGQYWFWMPNDPPKSVRTLYRLYNESIKRGANLLLSVPPDKTGRIPREHVNRLLELKEVIDNGSLKPPESLTCNRPAHASNVFHNRPEYEAANAVDEDPTTRWLTDSGTKQAWLEIDLGQSIILKRIKIEEPYGERVRKFEVQYKNRDEWRTFLNGTEIGRNFSRRFEPVTARYVRLKILDADEETMNSQNVVVTPHSPEIEEGPTISEFQLFSE